MSGITDPTEQYFKDGLWAWVTSAWVKLVATAGGLLKIQIGGQDADVTVKQTTPANLTPGMCGYVNDAWHKNPLLLGYSSQVVDKAEDTNLPAGASSLAGAIVPASTLWIITHISIEYIGTPPTYIEVCFHYASGGVPIWKEFAPASEHSFSREGYWLLDPGNYLYYNITGAAAGNDFYASASGFAIQIGL